MEEKRWSEGDERREEEEDGRCGNIDERKRLGKRRALNVKKIGETWV